MSNDVFAALAEIDPDAHIALRFVAHECIRQREVEGWSREHDDAHREGEMATAAACYAHLAGALIREDERAGKLATTSTPLSVPPSWPWDARWWKPKNVWRNLTRAGALIVSEMGRRMRQRYDDVSIDHEISQAARNNVIQKAVKP